MSEEAQAVDLTTPDISADTPYISDSTEAVDATEIGEQAAEAADAGTDAETDA